VVFLTNYFFWTIFFLLINVPYLIYYSDSQDDIVEAFAQLAGNGQYISPQQLSQHFNDAALCEYLMSSMPKAEDGSGNLDFAAFTSQMYDTSSKNGPPPPPQSSTSAPSGLERAGHRRVMSQRAAGLPQTASFLDSDTTDASTEASTKSARPKKARRQSWVKAETDEGETFYFDDPSLGGSGKTQWDVPHGEPLAGEYVEVVEQTEVVYNEEWTRHYNDDGTVVYTSNTGKSQTEPPPGFEAALESKPENNQETEVFSVEQETEAAASATATALYAYEAAGDNQTSLNENEIVVVLEGDAGGWTGVQSESGAGFVPSSYLQIN